MLLNSEMKTIFKDKAPTIQTLIKETSTKKIENENKNDKVVMAEVVWDVCGIIREKRKEAPLCPLYKQQSTVYC